MSTEPTPLQRVDQLAKVAEFLTKGIEELRAVIVASSEVTPAVTSALSTSEKDMEIMLKSVEQKPRHASLVQVENTLDKIVKKYLSPLAIEGGRGFIQPNAAFPQYQDDILYTAFDRTMTWTTGFFCNSVTKEIQLYIKTDYQGKRVAIAFDGLPGRLSLECVVIITGSNNIKTHDNDALLTMSPEEIIFVQEAIDHELNRVYEKYFS